ncbi:ATPase, T2SS/T4P/T4SS family [Candidatus Parabeggiatoa sp. HSG14]|uniref:ATPase, T2SS/T4P/T4SS family n=1 Tax=Candidatus Parabeggiatoa sp. HSG14 TaxID=3055593 RepID=UPI0025A75923|nr:ATPase, T2SS/T4P/T4SS family [Thiotrichales bacterium HSG14]
MTKEELLEIIKQATKNGVTSLDLSYNGLTELPPEIGQLIQLTELYLYKNQLITLPPEIGQLSKLTTLRLDNNKLTVLPPEIGLLINLKESSAYRGLKLDYNPLESPPPHIVEQGIETILAYLQAQLQEVGKKQRPSKLTPNLKDQDKQLDEISDENGSQQEPNEDDKPIIRFVNKMLFDAIKMDASNLHFEPYEKFYQVRFRVDGILKVVSSPPVSLSRKIAARIKLMSRLDVSEPRVPQDGRIKLKLSKDEAIDFRVSTCPTLWGEKIVMQILNPSTIGLDIDRLGFEEEQKRIYLEALTNSSGMILATGPAGSGKTITLYTGLNILNKENVNIFTVDDPVEINFPGINQVQVNERIGMSFAKVFKAFLRQSPNIFLIGEIRDLETASIAISSASATDILVMSALHTNDALQTLTHLFDMGVPSFAIAHAIKLIIAQRLVRCLCDYCKIEQNIPEQALLMEGFKKEEIPELKFYGPKWGGCNKCDRSGYKGRTGIFQVMPISENIKQLIMEGCGPIEWAKQAQREGIPDLRESGLKKVKNGITSLDEVNRVVPTQYRN